MKLEILAGFIYALLFSQGAHMQTYTIYSGPQSGSCAGAPGDVNGPSCPATQIEIPSDTLTAPGAIVSGLTVDHNFGGATSQGGFAGIVGTLNQQSQTANVGGNYVGGLFVVQGNTNDNGTPSSPSGAIWGLDTNVRIANTATYWDQVIGAELDVAAATGTSVADKIGLQIVETGIDAVRGSRNNLGITLGNAEGVATGWDIGLSFGNYNGYNPVNVAGTLVGSYPHAGAGSSGTVANGIDFSGYSFTGNFLKSVGFTVDGAGNATARGYAVGAVKGVSCSGRPSASFSVTNGIVTHC